MYQSLLSENDLASASIQDLEAENKLLIQPQKLISNKLRYAKSMKEQTCTYYVRNTIIILLILGYLFVVYGPYDLMEKLVKYEKVKLATANTLQKVLDVGGIILILFVWRIIDKEIIMFLKNTICSCICNQKFSDTKEFLLATSTKYNRCNKKTTCSG
jgi:hypothetical protein